MKQDALPETPAPAAPPTFPQPFSSAVGTPRRCHFLGASVALVLIAGLMLLIRDLRSTEIRRTDPLHQPGEYSAITGNPRVRPIALGRQAQDRLLEAARSLDEQRAEFHAVTRGLRVDPSWHEIEFDVFSAASAGGLQVLHLAKGPVHAQPPFRTITLICRVRGRFPAIYDFVDRLSTSDKPMRCEQIKIVRDPPSVVGAASSCSATLTLVLPSIDAQTVQSMGAAIRS